MPTSSFRWSRCASTISRRTSAPASSQTWAPLIVRSIGLSGGRNTQSHMPVPGRRGEPICSTALAALSSSLMRVVVVASCVADTAGGV
jgi:hypothetical protein